MNVTIRFYKTIIYRKHVRNDRFLIKYDRASKAHIESIITDLYNGARIPPSLPPSHAISASIISDAKCPIDRDLRQFHAKRPLFWANEAELIVARRFTWRFCQREHDEHLLHFPFTSERAAIYRFLFSHQPDKASTRIHVELHVFDSPLEKEISKAHLLRSLRVSRLFNGKI